MEVITIGGYIYPNNYQNPNNNAHLGRFFMSYSYCKKPPPEGLKIPPKGTHPPKPKNTLFLVLGGHLGGQLGGHFLAIFRVVE